MHGLLLICALAANPSVKFDHLWIMVSQGAPERAALKKAGFRIDPIVNRHDGQGTASVTFEFENSFLELVWLEPTVPVSPGTERAVEKFRQRMLWRTSGWCPFSIGMRRTSASPAPFPFPTWSVSPPWLQPGTAIEMLTPRDDTSSPRLFISANDVGDVNPRAAVHPIGVKRITSIRLIAPNGYQPIEAVTFVENAGILTLDRGPEWAVELTFDRGAKGKKKDLRPELPLLIRY
jgi:hypothetical protein